MTVTVTVTVTAMNDDGDEGHLYVVTLVRELLQLVLVTDLLRLQNPLCGEQFCVM